MMPKLALLSGGLATRLYPITEKIPKAMLTVAGKPFIHHQIELLKREGITDIVVCAGYLGGQIQEYLQDGSRFGLKIEYSFDGDRLLGTGGALKKALPLLGGYFFVMYGDSYLDIQFKPVLDFFVKYNKKGLMTILKNRDQWDKSNIVFKDNQIIQYDKNKIIKEMDYIDYGLSILISGVFDPVPGDMKIDLADILKKITDEGEMLGYEVYQRFYEIGSKNGLIETEEYITKMNH